jgi:CRP/FNR family transcriptional regulator, cyclic AMP receptor protein
MGSLNILDQTSAYEKRFQTGTARLWPTTAKSNRRHVAPRALETATYMDLVHVARNCQEFKSREVIFAQGDPATNVLYIQTGAVKLSFANENGDEAVVGILGEGNFLGEACLAGQMERDRTAVAIEPSKVLSIDKSEMIRLLQPGSILFDRFFNHLLSRTLRVEEDLVDQILNTSEKRLARTLLLLARNGKRDEPCKIVPKISQETLAEMVGTTRPRVTHFMNRFRKLGFIKYDGSSGALSINTSLLGLVLQG